MSDSKERKTIAVDEFVYDKRFARKLKEQDYLRLVLKGEEGTRKLAQTFPSLKKETLQKDMWKWENRVKTTGSLRDLEKLCGLTGMMPNEVLLNSAETRCAVMFSESDIGKIFEKIAEGANEFFDSIKKQDLKMIQIPILYSLTNFSFLALNIAWSGYWDSSNRLRETLKFAFAVYYFDELSGFGSLSDRDEMSDKIFGFKPYLQLCDPINPKNLTDSTKYPLERTPMKDGTYQIRENWEQFVDWGRRMYQAGRKRFSDVGLEERFLDSRDALIQLFGGTLPLEGDFVRLFCESASEEEELPGDRLSLDALVRSTKERMIG